MAPIRVALLGSGNWGCAIARIVGWNCKDLPDFEERVLMYVYEEEVRGRKLTEIINTDHENVKYLPGYKLPDNVIATPDVKEAARDADILVINMPHQVLPAVLEKVKDVVKPAAIAISLIKGHVEIEKGRPVLGSKVICDVLKVDTSVLMGANVSSEVARGDFCEATIGCESPVFQNILAKLFHRPTFHIRVSPDIPGIELCGGLKNVIALAAGFCDGLGYGINTKASIIRVGLLETSHFIRHFYPASQPKTMFESCGVADLITTCFGGRNRKCAEAYARDPTRTWDAIEKDLLGGQRLQGVSTAAEIWPLIKAHRLHKQLPLLRQIYRIACEGQPASSICEFAIDELPEAHVLLAGEATKRVAILGAGAWATAVSRVVAQNCAQLEEFEDEVKLYVRDEIFEGRKLMDIINDEHENTKYLPGFKIPENVVAVSSALEAARGADVVIVSVPVQFLPSMVQELQALKQHLAPGAFAVSLLKGQVSVGAEASEPMMATAAISQALGVPCAVLAGANVATEVAAGYFAEATLAAADSRVAEIAARVFHLPHFQVRCISDVGGTEIISALCNVIALAAGFCDGVGLGGNTKAALIRVGLLEIGKFAEKLFPSTDHLSTLFESCGVADLIAMSFGGRNRTCAANFAQASERTHRLVQHMEQASDGDGALSFGEAGKSTIWDAAAWRKFCEFLWLDVEKEVLNGQFCKGIQNLRDMWPLVQHYDMEAEVPMFRTIYRISVEGAWPSTITAFAEAAAGAASH